MEVNYFSYLFNCRSFYR